MLIFTDIANWFENKRKQSDEILDQWVEDSNYSQGAMIVASTTKAFTTFGAGFVDLLRLGDGVKSGTLKGLGTDALRIVAIFPVGKAAKILQSIQKTNLAKIVLDIGGPNCFWVASAKAFAQIGQKYNGKLLATVDDIAKALGMNIKSLWSIPNLTIGISYLRSIGANTSVIKAIKSVSEVEKMIPLDGSVLMLAVKVMKNGREIGRHAIYGFRNPVGLIRYMDRTVGNGATKVYRNINDIAPSYAADALIPYEGALLYNVFTKTLAHDLHTLAIPVLGAIAEE